MSGAVRASIRTKPRLGIMKFASCDGCQLTILDLEDHLLDLLERFDLVEFAEASSYRSSGPFDVVLVEGSISTPEQAEEIVRIRRETPLLVTIGACATAGGIQALRNWGDHDAYRSAVYAHPEYVESLATSTPIAAASIVAKVYRDRLMREAVASEAYQRLMQITLGVSFAGSPEDLAAWQEAETRKWGEIVRIAGMKEP